jgi:hypothetical protein
MFRLLKAEEIECRISTIKEKGASLLLYKDARCDMNILDETVGAKNWQRKHEGINNHLFCAVEIWDEEKKCWTAKQDVGEPSNSAPVKGEASDSFKRASFNWGIGRELYTAPFIWVKGNEIDMHDNKGKKATYDKFHVAKITYIGNKIDGLVIVNQKHKQVFVKMPKEKEGTQ